MNTWVTGPLARGIIALTFASTLALITPHALAEERVVSGKVVKVVPITETRAAHEMIAARRTETTCSHPKPATDSGLSLLIGWDLLHDCDGVPATEVVTGYQVFYEWDERIYSRRMIQHPGATVTLLLTVH